jgi:hypothetical protein
MGGERAFSVEKAALLGGNARRFFRLPARSRPAQVAGVKG